MNSAVITPITEIGKVRIQQEGDRVRLIVDGKLVADLQWTEAEDLVSALHVQTQKAKHYHWSIAERSHGSPIKVKQVFNMPLLDIAARKRILGR